MLNSIRLQNFKGFRDTYIGQLRKVNLVVGGQNVGKTSLLEALYTSTINPSIDNVGRDQINNAIHGSHFRRYIGGRPSKWSAYSLGQEQTLITITSPIQTGLNPTTFPVYPVEEADLVRLYEAAIRNKTKSKLIGLLKKVEPRLEGLESINAVGEATPCVHADIGLPELTPLSELGQGFNRLAYLYAGLLGNDSRLALIDEIENGIHYSSLRTVFEGIKVVAQQQDVQTIMTTHSMDCIKAANRVFEDSPQDFQVIRLVRTADNIEADIIPADAVQAVLEYNGEVR